MKASITAQVSQPVTQDIEAPVSGQIEGLEKVNDQVFSQKMLGEGFAIVPSNGSIVAPIDGKIVSVMSTKHALTMTSTKGNLEILIHLGIDTVELKGEPFDITVKEGQEVKGGQSLGTTDIDQIKKAGKDPVVIMTVTNKETVKDIKLLQSGEVKASAPVLEVTSK